MTFTRHEVQVISDLRRELSDAPKTVTRQEALRICTAHGVDAPKYRRGAPSTEIRLLDVIVYIARRTPAR
jgi:hypothetical protein